MTEQTPQASPEPEGSGGRPFEFTDKRRIDPEAGTPREPGAAAAGASAGSGPSDDGAAGNEPAENEPAENHPGGNEPGGNEPDATDPLEALDFEPSGEAEEDAAVLAAKAEAAQHLDALQRERASFTNYRNRALRDQEIARERGVQDVLAALLPVLDDVERAKQHGELSGPMAAIAEKLDQSLAKFGVERFGQVGEEFDPQVHDALMHNTDAEATSTTVNLVVEPGYRIGEKVVRAARVGVVGPE
ncbi:nucleotide exchange factor GrpE [Myceligenerans pegani]|uniref:Protein GrpE n=1 Tax=Myceligenerans pegani TaxID=2776917 RepID=A0ABR9MWX5_9MICO|nr:nucleotide exchange factor GrpE [Myceligenerans sp. TRM 65318]MBE1875883.1 nucleotide exchange factor GrpE [Myceligenerans sp. TRM 65318]MBE3018154.1 nucleotide exchange factor GrpE [Myceligenerans sp. TRM 65318]